MKENYTEEQIDDINRVAVKYYKSPDDIRNLLDRYWDSHFNEAISSIVDDLFERQYEMNREAEMDNDEDYYDGYDD